MWTGMSASMWIDTVGAPQSPAEQMGQRCVPAEDSVQKCVWAPKKAITRSNATNCILGLAKCMCLLGRSLGQKGSWVKSYAGFKMQQPDSKYVRLKSQGEVYT